jgi:hypothetical protein
MNDVAAPANALEAGRRHLCAELARIRALLERAAGTPDADAHLAAAEIDLETARGELAIDAPVDLLTDLFGLTPFERDLLLLAAGVELDSSLAAACAAVQAASPLAPTFSVALAALPAPHWSALLPERPLRHWRLIEVDGGVSLTRAALRIDERILHFVAGLNVLDARLRPLVRAVAVSDLVATSHRAAAARVAAALDADPAGATIQLSGDDAQGAEDVAALVCSERGWTLYALSSADVPAGRAERLALADLWSREAALLDAALLVSSGAEPASAALGDFLDAVAGPTFVTLRDPLPLRRATQVHAVTAPGWEEQRALWRLALGERTHVAPETLDRLAGHARASARDIARLGPQLAASGLEPEAALRAVSQLRPRGGLDALAERVRPAACWHDLVLPSPTIDLLREIAAHARHGHTVHDAWGFGAITNRGRGLAALFVGDSGTGKTLAAEVLANDLGLDLHRIDLAQVVSKYIGETEKNLRRVFDAAEEAGGILFFDEADALFGKRSDVKDSHDRYANIEVSYLLQRMEAYRGIAILATNMKAALDRAFQRRVRFIVPFPFPDAALRRQIWSRAFPPGVPTEALDAELLSRLAVSGGTIANIALRAAFRAARAGGAVTMAHVLAAARGEYDKLERAWSDAELRGRG